MNTEMKKIVGRIKDAQIKLQDFVKDQDWVEEARRYAERQGTEVRKLLTSDVHKVRIFIERERKELERFQKRIPGSVKKFREVLKNQKSEFEKIMKKMSRTRATHGAGSGAGSGDDDGHRAKRSSSDSKKKTASRKSSS